MIGRPGQRGQAVLGQLRKENFISQSKHVVSPVGCSQGQIRGGGRNAAIAEK